MHLRWLQLLVVSFASAGAPTLAAYTYSTLDFPSATNTVATGISGSTIVGYYNLGGTHGFIFDGTNWTKLDVPSASITYATGISGDNVVGYYYLSNQIPHGFIYHNGTYSTLDAPLSNGTVVLGISGSTIMGNYYGSNSATHGFTYNGQSWTTVDVPSATDGTFVLGAYGGSLVGMYEDQVAPHTLGEHGFVYDGSTFTTLDDPTTEIGNTYANGIWGNLIVGYSAHSILGYGGVAYSGFIYDGTTWTALNFPNQDPNPASSTFANGISGDTVVGSYGDPNGSSNHGFILTIPEPSSLCVISPFALLLLNRGRARSGLRRAS